MLEVEYAIALAEVICEENLPDSVRVLRFNGVRRLKGIAESYAKEGILEKPITEMWLHKIEFVLKATSKVEMEEILRPSAPKYDGGKFIPKSPYHSEAEEMILWSMTSLRGPLVSSGFDRYMSLFKKYFPDEAAYIWPTAS